jgi:hypothetical protein
LIYIDDADSADSSSLDCDVLLVATKRIKSPMCSVGPPMCIRSIRYRDPYPVGGEAVRILRATREYRKFDSGVHYDESTLIPIVVPKARAHRSSMLQDIEAGHKTEIDYLKVRF